jgi:hypothetical protein
MKLLFAVLLTVVLGTARAAGPAEGQPLKGTVLETIEAGSYTYLRLKTPDGETWAAITATVIPSGTNIVIHDPMLMTDFESKSLDRKFDEIYFGSQVGTSEPQVADKAAAGEYMRAHGGMGSKIEAPVQKVAKATGANARTVAEVYSQRTQLKGKSVVVQGQVVKYSSGIMDRNWIHLRDGTGSSANASNDLLVTAKQPAKVGDVLVVTGPVRTDVDYGAGYIYAVVIEGATLKK